MLELRQLGELGELLTRGGLWITQLTKIGRQLWWPQNRKWTD